MTISKAVAISSTPDTGMLLLGTGLAFASLILLPAVAARFGVGAALTGAMRIALMRASSQVVGKGRGDNDAPPPGFSCH